MIKTFSISQLQNPVYVQFMDYVQTLVSEHNPVSLNVKPQFDIFSQKVTELKNIFVTAQSSPISQQITQADILRDQSMIGIMKVVDGFSYHFDDDMRESAIALQRNIKLYGRNIVRDNLDTETSKIESLVGDWRTKTELVNAVDMLGILDWVLQLETANNEFKRLYALRNTEYSQRPDENMESKRIEVTSAYFDLCTFLNSYSVINTTNPDYAVVISGINSYIDHYSTLLKQTRTRKPETNPSEN